MPLALKRYLICLSIVSALMAIYSAVVTPWLQTPKREVAPVSSTANNNLTDGWWNELFEPGDWQNQRPMMIQTAQGTLLFKDLKQLDSGERVHLSPLTLIVPLSQEARSLPVGDPSTTLSAYRNSELAVIEAPEGAEIEFEKVPDWTSATKPPVVRGQLLGSIEIRGMKPKSEVLPDQSRVAWSIFTSKVRIEGRRIWTNNDVEFLAGNSRALGKDLAIGLKRDLMGSGSGGSGEFGLLDYLELRTIKEVTVRLPEGGLWKDIKLGRPEVAQAHAQLPASVTLRCKGSLVFDFDESRASLSDDVNVEHRFDNDPQADLFNCHELIAQFSVLNQTGPADPTAIMIGPMRLDSVDALGIDSVGPRPAQSTVQVVAPNISTGLVAKWLRVKLKPKLHEFFLDSRNGRSSEGARANKTQVTLSYMGTSFRAPDLYFSKYPNEEQISLLKANGPGEVQTSADSPVGAGSAAWKTSLVMRPAELVKDTPSAAPATLGQTVALPAPRTAALSADNQAQVVILEGLAELQAQDRGFLRSDQIMITLRPAPAAQPSSTNTAATSMRVERLDAFSKERAAGQAQDVMGDVLLGNPTQNIQVKNLHFEFLYPEQTSSAATTNDLELTDAAGRPMRQWVGPPGKSPTGAPSTTPGQLPGAATAGPGSFNGPGGLAATTLPGNLSSPTAAPVLPIGLPLSLPTNGQGPPTPGSLASTSTAAPGATRVLILGKELHSQIIMATPKPWIDRLIITGPVVVSPDGPVDPETPAWRVAGNEFMLNGGIDERYELQIVGKQGADARITFGDGWIEGPVIRLSQRTGHVWIDQSGTLCVPASLVGRSTTNNSGPAVPAGPLGSAQGLQWIEPVKVRWDRGMLFNGTTANIRGQITFDGYARSGPDRLLFLKGTCEAIEVRLTENINLGNPGKTSSTIHNVTLRDNVDIRTAQTDLQRNRVSLEEILLPELTFEVTSNILRGKGPGEIHSQHQATGSPVGQMAGSARPRSSQLQGLHLTFRDYMELKLIDKLLDFKGRVEVGVGPVPTLDTALDIAQMRTLTADQSLMRGDHLRIYDTRDLTRSPTASLADGAWEMEATGNVNFETRTESGEMFGRASRITYMQAKELVVIDGDPQIPAEIRFRPDDTSRYVLAILSLWQGSINTRSLQPSGDLKIAGNSQFVPRGANLPANWKTGNINASTIDQPPAGAPAGASTVPVNPPPARPRDAINEWFKQ